MKAILIGLVGLTIVACATVSNTLGAAYIAVQTTAETVTRECGNTAPDGPCLAGSLIETDDRNEIKLMLLDALDALDLARSAVAQGNESDANSQLRQAQRILSVAEQILISRGVQL